MNPLSLAGRKVTILGWARSGRPAASLAASLGADVFVSDSRPLSAMDDASRRDAEKYPREFGGHTERARDADLIILSPGIPPTVPILKGYRGEVWSEIELASRCLACPIVAVTGTNGKTTTTTLIGEILHAGWTKGKIWVAGNIGRAATTVAAQAVSGDICVLEVSSFQLETIRRFRPHVAVFLNLRSDHMDRYRDFAEYRRAKERIFLNMTENDFAVINIDDAVGVELAESLNVPRIVSVSAVGEADHVLTADYDARMLAAAKSPENLLSAVAVGQILGIPGASIMEALGRFRGLPHRLEEIVEADGVAYYNDSKATNVAATASALRVLERPVVLIMGGKDKGEDYRELEPLIRARCRVVIAYGEGAERISREVGAKIVPLFDEAVRAAASLAEPGDAVLLSPSCSSYDQFTDYAARGERFRELALELVRRPSGSARS